MFKMKSLNKPSKKKLGWGSKIRSASASASASASHQLLRHSPLKFFWVACFLFPRSLAFDFCGQGQALRAFFVVISFFTILSKV